MSATYEFLDYLLTKAPVRAIQPQERYVIFSDLHMGDGGRNDDFIRNGKLFREILLSWYLPKGYILILNGDIEELLRAHRESIIKAWHDIYAIFEEFRAANRLVWLRGNHEMLTGDNVTIPCPPLGNTLDPARSESKLHGFDGEALRLEWHQKSLLIFHGHQAGVFNSGKYNRFVGFFLRTFANALGIGNRSVSQDSEKKFHIEKTVYDFSKSRGILSMIGHTHRPLFESLSKKDALNFQIERLCREYARRADHPREDIRHAILQYRDEYLAEDAKNQKHLANTVYGDILIPCLFNSGCGIGKRGLTSLEIKQDRMYLVFWTDHKRLTEADSHRSLRRPTEVGEDAVRVIVRRENLDYIFARIDLLQ